MWLNSVTNAGLELLKRESKAGDANDVVALCHELLSSRGEAMGTALAQRVLRAYSDSGEAGRRDFFQALLVAFGPDDALLAETIEAYQRAPSAKLAGQLHECSEPRRQELLRRINMAPGGTHALVKMREDLLREIKADSALATVDGDFRHLMRSWFNRGFLRCEQIDWHTPAAILEKLMNYEAVHPMAGWEDLRRRLASDRRCFAFFHPSMSDEPLIFIEVALTRGVATSVQRLLTEEVDGDAEKVADTAIFYSISDCQAGLKGITLGNFLIKQVVMELQRELPTLQYFITLSPMPGFRRWLNAQRDRFSEDLQKMLVAIDESQAVTEEQGGLLAALGAYYLYEAKRHEQPVDPVARFHLRNGAAIAQVNAEADTSLKGREQSLGLMVNYRYSLGKVEERHETFVNYGHIHGGSLFMDQLALSRQVLGPVANS